MGNESIYISSLLERITKCHLFPRDNKICTKYPIHVMLDTGEKYRIAIDNHNIITGDKTSRYENNIFILKNNAVINW
jgi:hypothetical protein